MADTRLLQGKNNEAGTFGATLSAGGLSATLSVAVGKAPGVIVADIETAQEEHIYYASKDDVTKTISGLIRDYTNLNGGVGFEHLQGQPWETAQSIEYINNLVDALREGYVSEFNTIAYVSATSFTVLGDQTATYTAGRPLRYNNDNTKLGIVASSSFNGGSGLTTVVTNFGTVPAVLTQVEFGIQPKGAALATGLGVQGSTYNYALDTGAANAYVMTLTPAPTAYSTGMRIIFKAVNANTAASTVNVNAIGAKNLYINDQPLPVGFIKAGSIVEAVYDGTQFQVTSITRENGWVDLTDGATINIDLSLGNKFRLINANALGGNRTFTVSNNVVGKPWILVIQQDDTGSRTVTWFSGDSTFATTDVDTSGDIITVGRDIPTGTPIIFSTTGGAPAGITAGTTYYAIRASATTIKVATSLANAQAGTQVDITSQGTGTHTVKAQVRWGSAGTAPTLSTGKRRLDVFGFISLLTGIYTGYTLDKDL